MRPLFGVAALVIVAMPGAVRERSAVAVELREPAGFEDYRTPVGRIENGVLRVTLEAGVADWQPWGPDGPTVRANVFAADGVPPRIPGPLIRVTAGTPVRITLRNGLPDSIAVRGLRDRSTNPPPGQRLGAFTSGFVEVPPGGVTEIRFTPTSPGTYFYFGRVYRPMPNGAPQPVFSVTRGPFEGVMIVDPPGGRPLPDERILLLGHWADREYPGSWQPGVRFMINGRAWPYTERLEYAQHDTVRWRVINGTGIGHPMHLHGFHFSVDARGDQWRETVHSPDARPLAVTEHLNPSETMRISWVAKEPGNWLFHCHLMRHMSWLQSAPLDREPPSHNHSAQGTALLGGMVMGIIVRPHGASAPRPVARRRLPLYIGMRGRVFGVEPGYGFVLQDGVHPPAPDSIRFPGSPIVLTRGERTEIVVHNRTDTPIGVHWHGLELESRGDGVPGWSGNRGVRTPAVAAGDSLVVHITPPRSGTFMYHVHSESGHQLAQGLYGPFLVMEPGQRWDPNTDRVLVLGSLGATLDAAPAVNGRLRPDPMELRAGTTYRLRFMHISPDDRKAVQLLVDGQPVRWQTLAKDGADLPATLARVEPADFSIDVGETYDFAWTPERAGDLTLRITTTFQANPPGFARSSPSPHTMEIAVRVR
jgi:FtsP/CotA-like multicopper oxidase with cupredoxin domain